MRQLGIGPARVPNITRRPPTRGSPFAGSSRVNERVEETLEETAERKRRQTDEAMQLVMGVALIAFTVIAVGFLLAMRVSDVLSRPY